MRTKEDIVFKVIQVVLIICIIAFFLLDVYTAYLFSEKIQVPLFKTIVEVIATVFIAAAFILGPTFVEGFVIDPTNDYELKIPLIFTFIFAVPPILYFLFTNIINFSGINIGWLSMDKVQPEIFWFSFWKSFYAIPIIFLLSRLFNNSGDKINPSYQWALGNSNSGYRSATQKDVWNHMHKGSRTWDQNQKLKTNIIFAVLLLGFYALTFRDDLPISTHVIRFVALLLAGGFSAGYLYSLYKAVGFDLESNDFKPDDGALIPFIAGAISIIAMIGIGLFHLIFYLVKKELLFSLNYLWIPMLIAPLAWLIKNELTNQKVQQVKEDSLIPYYYDNPDALSLWAFVLSQQLENRDTEFTFTKDSQLYRHAAERCDTLISQSSYILNTGDLIDQTEALMLALVRGESISIVVPAVYDHRTFLIETAQKLYFHYVNRYNHPIKYEIREKLSGY